MDRRSIPKRRKSLTGKNAIARKSSQLKGGAASPGTLEDRDMERLAEDAALFMSAKERPSMQTFLDEFGLDMREACVLLMSDEYLEAQTRYDRLALELARYTMWETFHTGMRPQEAFAFAKKFGLLKEEKHEAVVEDEIPRGAMALLGDIEKGEKASANSGESPNSNGSEG